MMGHYLAGWIVKNLDRIAVLRLSTFFSFVLSLLLAQTSNYVQFSAIRLASGLFHGIIYTLRTSIPTEITPTKHRSWMIILVASGGIAFPLAGLISVWVGEIYLDNIQKGN